MKRFAYFALFMLLITAACSSNEQTSPDEGSSDPVDQVEQGTETEKDSSQNDEEGPSTSEEEGKSQPSEKDDGKEKADKQKEQETQEEKKDKGTETESSEEEKQSSDQPDQEQTTTSKENKKNTNSGGDQMNTSKQNYVVVEEVNNKTEIAGEFIHGIKAKLAGDVKADKVTVKESPNASEDVQDDGSFKIGFSAGSKLKEATVLLFNKGEKVGEQVISFQ